MTPFKTSIAENVFRNKYAQGKDDTWEKLAERCVDDVCGTMGGTLEPLLSLDSRKQLTEYIKAMKFIPGGRYLYYAGRPLHAFNNCFMLRGESDTREEWGALLNRASDCLMTGGGIGIDYSVFRPSGNLLSRTGGKSSGPIPLMNSVNEVGRNIMQGGSRRSAIYASLNWRHGDAGSFLKAKNWDSQKVGKSSLTVHDLKQEDFNFPAPLDMTNISLNYDNKFLHALGEGALPETFIQNVEQALRTGEPGFSFNFNSKENETLRNACCELTSEDDSDVCNLGSANLGEIDTIGEFCDVVHLGTQFLLCGTLRGDLPYAKVHEVREKNRRLGLGLMGIHAWLLKKRYPYEVVKELDTWLKFYRDVSENSGRCLADKLSISRPVAYRAIAPTGTIGILASTTTGIEPMIATAYKRRYLIGGSQWKYEYVVDATADHLIKDYGIQPESIETAYSLAENPEKRIKFQWKVQKYVDHAISSTINLPEWGSDYNNPDKVRTFAELLAQYAPGLRGFTCYPNGARGGQPLTEVPYKEALQHVGHVYDELDVCSLSGKGGTCGI